MKTLTTWIKQTRRDQERHWPIPNPEMLFWDEQTPVKAALSNPNCTYMHAEFLLPDGRVSVVEVTNG